MDSELLMSCHLLVGTINYYTVKINVYFSLSLSILLQLFSRIHLKTTRRNKKTRNQNHVKQENEFSSC